MKPFLYITTAIVSFGIGNYFSLFAAETSTISGTTAKSSSSTRTESSTSTSSHDKEDQSQLAAWVLESGKAAQDYVEGLDQEKYADSWSKGDQIFQHTITKEEWADNLKDKRKPLGKMKSRTLKDQRIAKDPHGLPKGAYMIVQYKTTFANGPEAEELITLRRGSDGKWRVLTYQIN